MRRTIFLPVFLLIAGCTSSYDVRVEGRVMAPRTPESSELPAGLYSESKGVPAEDLEPVDEAIVSIAPRFGSSHVREVAHSGPVDETGAFRFASSGATGRKLRGVSVRVTAPGFLPVDAFVPANEKGRFERRDLLVVLEDARASAARAQGVPAR